MYSSRVIYEKRFPGISMEDYDWRIEDTKKSFLHTNTQAHKPF